MKTYTVKTEVSPHATGLSQDTGVVLWRLKQGPATFEQIRETLAGEGKTFNALMAPSDFAVQSSLDRLAQFPGVEIVVTEGGETMSLTREEIRLLQKVLSDHLRDSAKLAGVGHPAALAGVTDWWRDVALPLQDKLSSLEQQAPLED